MIRVKWFDRELKEEIRKKQLIALKKAGALLEGKIKKSMRPGHYRKSKRGNKIHWSSFPDDAPAVDTGRLRASITFQTSDGVGGTEPQSPAKPDDGVKQPTADKNETVLVVGTNVEYSLGLELGSGRTEPRPFLRPALEKNKKKILKLFNFMSK